MSKTIEVTVVFLGGEHSRSEPRFRIKQFRNARSIDVSHESESLAKHRHIHQNLTTEEVDTLCAREGVEVVIIPAECV